MSSFNQQNRVLVIDDNPEIHVDFRKILEAKPEKNLELDLLAAELFGDENKQSIDLPSYQVDSAFQGMEGIIRVKNALIEQLPYHLAFLDVQMPPGINGIQTASKLWEIQPALQIVICTAYADYSWEQMISELGLSDKLVVLKKPFDKIEVQQLAACLTRKYQLEKQNLQYMDSLEAQVKERTKDLEVLAQKAENANRMKSQFLANMSHELRTPLTSILGFTESLQEIILNSDEMQMLNTIERNGKHLLHLINDILDLSKIEAGKLDFEWLNANPKEIIQNVCLSLNKRALDNDCQLTWSFAPDFPDCIQTDPARFQQIITNIVSNAVKFSPHGNVNVSASLSGMEFKELVMTITDTGIGMSKETMEKLFRPFTQADASLTRKYGGTGLGLSITASLLEMLGGSISVESELGKGSTFTIRLPQYYITANPDLHHNSNSDIKIPAELYTPASAAAPHTTSATTTTNNLSNLRLKILLAEDGLDNQKLIKHILSKMGADVDVVENGQLAVDRITESLQQNKMEYDLILMDMQMPVLDGYQATKLLRKLECKLPIIAVTAHAMADDKEKCIVAGCDDYLTKPINKKELQRLLYLYTQRSEGQQAPQEPKILNSMVSLISKRHEKLREIKHENRNVIRTHLLEPAKVAYIHENEIHIESSFEVIVKDASVNGLCLLLNQPLNADTIAIQIDPETPLLWSICSVCWAKPLGENFVIAGLKLIKHRMLTRKEQARLIPTYAI